jgi:hypothetical protein
MDSIVSQVARRFESVALAAMRTRPPIVSRRLSAPESQFAKRHPLEPFVV